MNTKYTARTPALLGFAALFLLVGLLGVWSISAKIAGAVIASGVVEVESNRQVIEHPDGGIVADILVKDGTEVKAGDPLIKLDAKLLTSELQIIEDQYFELKSRQARLLAAQDNLDTLVISDDLKAMIAVQPAREAQLEGQTNLLIARRANAEAEVEQLKTQKQQIEKQITGVNAQLKAMSKQAVLIEKERADTQSLLDKGLSQASRVLALEREAARIEGSIGELKAQSAQLASRISEIEIAKLRLTSQRQEEAITELRDVEPRILELTERRLSLSTRLERLTLRAPMDGVIYGSQVFAENSVISAAEPIMFIVPQSQPLVISARVESIHVDQVYPGQDATLRFPSFDQRLTPEIKGRIVQVSADAFQDEATGQQFYEATLEPKENEITKLGDQTLLPGMPVEAFIQTGERTPLSYLVKPLTDYFTKAWRES